MTILRLTGDFNDPWLECDECDMRYQVIWNRNPLYECVEHCPFCGDEVDEVIDELEYPARCSESNSDAATGSNTSAGNCPDGKLNN